MKDYKNERCLIFDESGNLGKDGRYFVIACIDTNNIKELHNIIKRKIWVAKRKFPNMKAHSNEVKASDAYPMVKYHLLECIIRKSIKIAYIVADLNFVEKRLLIDKNIFYNYLEVILIKKLINYNDLGKTIHIISDNKTTKVASANSFADYLKVSINYEMNWDIKFDVSYMDSNDKNAYIVQAADYVANAIYSNYEYKRPIYFDIIKDFICVKEKFPIDKFGK